jgi:CDGSH-type Zn-finger protein/truncated hemoglobin YjbI
MHEGALDDQISSMLSSVVELTAELERHPVEALPDAVARLTTRVSRPLAGLSTGSAATRAVTSTATSKAMSWPSAEVAIWELARAATAAAAAPNAPVAVAEAAAALQEMVSLTGDAGRLTELADLQAARPAGVQVVPGGPYLVTGADSIVTHLGEPLPPRPLTALCRCGESADKPWCDGRHASIGFEDGKDPKRVPDRRDTYVGQQVTVLDNRGICAHSGLCTDRLSSVFHAGSEPFVTASGGRMDDIIRAVRDCPSGALSFAVDGREPRELVDQPRDRAVTVTADGPYRFTGGLPVTDGKGAEVQRATGSSREHYSLCRCGHSQNKPFCSGMHYYVDFRDPVRDPHSFVSLFEWAGGLPALLRMTRIFYERYVPADDLVGPIFAQMSDDHPERVAEWLSEVFGGPKFYSSRRGGYHHMLSQHVGRDLSERQRARWVELICRSAEDARLPADAEFRAAFVAYLEWGSRLAFENSQGAAQPPPNMPMPRWWWVCEAEPRYRTSALAPAVEEEPAEIERPAEGETVSFATHVKPLFRVKDRQSMLFAFDLWSYDDVRAHSTAILDQLANGSMPCDTPWPADQVEILRRWTTTGMNP